MQEENKIPPDLQSSLMCDDVRQERNGKFMLIGIFDVIGLAGFPNIFTKLCVVNRWCCGTGEFYQHSRIIKPDNKTVLAEGKKVKILLKEQDATATSVEIFMNLKFDEPGTYWVEILLDNDLKIRYPLKTVLIQPPPNK